MPVASVKCQRPPGLFSASLDAPKDRAYIRLTLNPIFHIVINTVQVVPHNCGVRRGKTVKLRRGPAAVTGDAFAPVPLASI